MINSPWQADDDADNQSGDNRGDSARPSISLTVPHFFEFCNQAVSLMLELTITSARQWSPDIAATVDCLTDIYDQCRQRHARLICCNATASIPDFSEREVFQVFFSGILARENGSVRRLLIWVWVQRDKFARVIGVISKWLSAYNDVITMISGFLTSVSVPPTTPAYRGTPYVDYWFLPSSTPAFSSEAFDKRTNRVSTDVADKHARYISEIAAN